MSNIKIDHQKEQESSHAEAQHEEEELEDKIGAKHVKSRPNNFSSFVVFILWRRRCKSLFLP